MPAARERPSPGGPCGRRGRGFRSSSPGRDVAVAYPEGKDPVGANREFAASAAPYDRWQRRLKELFRRSSTSGQPVPTNETVWDWTRS